MHKIKKTNTKIRTLDTIFRVNIDIYVELFEEIFEELKVNDFVGDGINDSNFLLLDYRRSNFPRFSISWDVDFNDKKVQKNGINNFKKDYNKEIERVLTNSAFTVINMKSEDNGLRFLSIFLMNIFEMK